MAAFVPSNVKKYTDCELGRYYNGMCFVARVRAVPFQEWDTLAERRDRVMACLSLYGLLHKSDNVLQDSRTTPGLRRLRNDPRAEDVRQQTLADWNAAQQWATTERQQLEKTMNDEVNGAAVTDDPKQQRKPRKAAKVKAAGKNKGKAKGKAKKAPAPKKVKKAPGKRAAAPRASDDDNRKIVVKTKENPRRAGTVQFERYAAIVKHNGKTVATYKKNGGDSTALSRAIKGKDVSLSA